jgi:hypothetical protein
MTTVELVVYLLMFALSVIWSIMAAENNKELMGIVYALLSFVSWLVLATIHIIIAWDTSVMVVCVMYSGMSLMFFILTITWGIRNTLNVNQSKEWIVD